MIVQSFNPYMNEVFQYDVPPDELGKPMYQKELHSNEKIPAPTPLRTMCGYCYTVFESRNKLFYHLGFHGIDIRGYDDNEIHKHKKRKNQWRKYKERCKQRIQMKRKEKHHRMRDLEDFMKDLDLK